MNFIDHAQILIPALSGLAVTVFMEGGDVQSLELFEKNFCFLKNVQTLYTRDGFLSFFRKKSGGCIYTVVDPLGIHAVIVKVIDRWVILGPYVIELAVMQGVEKTTPFLFANFKKGVLKN